MCNCRSEDPWECESIRWEQPSFVKTTACMCDCHGNDDDEEEPCCGHCGSSNCTGSCLQEDEEEDGDHDTQVPGCNCHDCIP